MAISFRAVRRIIQMLLAVRVGVQLHLVVPVLITNGSLQQTEQLGRTFLVRQTQPIIQPPLVLLLTIEEPLFVRLAA